MAGARHRRLSCSAHAPRVESASFLERPVSSGHVRCLTPDVSGWGMAWAAPAAIAARPQHSRLIYARRMTRVLFVCVQNAGRSQIAQALYEQRGGEGRSAGSEPAAELHEVVVEALEEVGIDVSRRV